MAVIEEVPEEPPAQEPTASGSRVKQDEAVEKLADYFAQNGKPALNPNFPSKMSLEDKLKSMDNVPLFMRDLPGEDEEDGKSKDHADETSSAALEALKSLAHDGTPDEIADNFKSQGNEYFTSKRYREAISFYTQAIEAFPTDQKLLESCYLNRAACNLNLKNYGQTLRDTSQALAINPRSEKAFFRAAKALLETDKTTEALDCCDHGLEINPENKQMIAIRKEVMEKKTYAEKILAERAERERRKKETALALHKAFLARGLWIENSAKPPDNPAKAHFDLESLSDESKPTIPLTGAQASKWRAPNPIRTQIIFPVFLLYPQYAQSDLIPEYPEDTPVGLYLDEMFPPSTRLPWDVNGEYTSAGLHVYATTHKKRLLRVGRKTSLRELLDQGAKDVDKGEKRDGVLLQDGLISLVVLPKGSDAEKEWIAKFKKDRDTQA